jgi:endo-1,4-beta-xylanase
MNRYIRQALTVCFLLLCITGITCSAGQNNDTITPESPQSSTVAPQNPDAKIPDEPAAESPDREETLPAESLEDMTLRQLADRKHMYIGTYFPSQAFTSTSWREVAGNEFNLAVVYQGLSWNDVERQQGKFDFKSADQQIMFAQSKNMEVCGHAIIFPLDLPNWLVYSDFNNDEILDILTNHVTEVVSRYKGQIAMWIPVEEATLVFHNRTDFFYDRLGLDYIDIVYRTIRNIDPDALLLYNDYDNHSSNGITTGFTREIVQRLKAQGLIDGVGLEMHLDSSSPLDKQDLIATMQSYDVPVHITELDIDITNLKGTMEERYEIQASMYRTIMEACLESGVCESFSVWGIGDTYSWLSRNSSHADPTPFDDALNPKPAYFALHDALAKD